MPSNAALRLRNGSCETMTLPLDAACCRAVFVKWGCGSFCSTFKNRNFKQADRMEKIHRSALGDNGHYTRHWMLMKV